MKTSTYNPKDINKIKQFAKDNNLTFEFNKFNNPSISLSTNFEILKAYDTHVWPALVQKITYIFQYPHTDNLKPISLRKTFTGIEDTNMRSSKFALDKEHNKLLEKFLYEHDNNISQLQTKFLKQYLMNKFSTIEEALTRVKLNLEKVTDLKLNDKIVLQAGMILKYSTQSGESQFKITSYDTNIINTIVTIEKINKNSVNFHCKNILRFYNPSYRLTFKNYNPIMLIP